MAHIQVTLTANVNGITVTSITVRSLTTFEALFPGDISLAINATEMGMWGWRVTTYAFSINNGIMFNFGM